MSELLNSGYPIGGKIGGWTYFKDCLIRVVGGIQFKHKHSSKDITISILKQTVILEKMFEPPYAQKYYDKRDLVSNGVKSEEFLKAGYVYAPYIPLKF